MMSRQSKDWVCPSCSTVLGKVVLGELVVQGQVKNFNTDKANIVITCPSCEYHKVWYSNDRMSEFAREIAEIVAKIMQS